MNKEFKKNCIILYERNSVLKCLFLFESIASGRHGQNGQRVAQVAVKEQEQEFGEYCLMKKMTGHVKVIALKLHMLIVETVPQVS